MCMTSVAFALEYNKDEKCLVGIGYKSMYLRKYKIGKWYKCKGFTNRPSRFDKSLRIRADNGRGYLPGFHIFLNQNAADNYWLRESIDSTYKVIYRDVIAFGRDKVQSNGHTISMPCIIAKEMKIIGKV